jgi:hypothetical protein
MMAGLLWVESGDPGHCPPQARTSHGRHGSTPDWESATGIFWWIVEHNGGTLDGEFKFCYYGPTVFAVFSF